jgi:hypothetical protein
MEGFSSAKCEIGGSCRFQVERTGMLRNGTFLDTNWTAYPPLSNIGIGSVIVAE